MNLEELQEVLKKHGMWLNDEDGGERAYLRSADLRSAALRSADLRSADLRSAALRSADLRSADLCGADLRGADLRGANLRSADLCGADLSDADLSDADLRGADLKNNRLWDTCGENRFIKTLRNCGKYTITYTSARIQIGCKNYSIDEWFSFSDEEIERMDTGALEWWSNIKDWLKDTITRFPAE